MWGSPLGPPQALGGTEGTAEEQAWMLGGPGSGDASEHPRAAVPGAEGLWA